MTCKDIEEKLAAYQEEVLSPEEKALVETHLDTCVKCFSALDDLKKTIKALKDLPDVDPPQWFTQKIMAQIREESGQKRGLLKKLFYPFYIKIPIETFAALLIVVIGVYIYQSTVPETRTVAQIPKAEIQQTEPPAEQFKPTESSVKDATETKGRPYFLGPPVKEKGDESFSPAENLVPAKQMQMPTATDLSGNEMDIEKKREGVRGAPGLQQTPASPSAPLAKEKETLGAADIAQKDSRELKKLRTPMASKSALAEKQTFTVLSVHVTDVQAAIQEIERILVKLGAPDVTKDFCDGAECINAQLRAERTKELIQQLSTVGVVKEKDVSTEFKEDSSFFRIKITKSTSSR